jgi:hypothetical protein
LVQQLGGIVGPQQRRAQQIFPIQRVELFGQRIEQTR